MSVLEIINLLLFLGIAAYALYLFGNVIYKRYMYVRLGKPYDFNMDLKKAISEVLVNVFGQKKLLKDKKSGIMHFIMFYGFIIIQFGAIDLFIKGLSPGNHLPVPAYPFFLFMQEIVTTLVLLATLYAFYRRYVEKLARLKRGFKSGLVIIFLSVLMTSILFSAVFEKIMYDEPLTWYTPVSSLLAMPFMGWMSVGAATVLFYIFWWIHAIDLFTFMVYVPQSKHFHLLVAPLNVFVKRQQPPAKLSAIDFEDESLEEYGVGKIEDFNQKQLIDLYACVECGRCTNVCPAAGTGKLLSPMDLIVKMRDHLTAKGAAITSKSPWVPNFAFAGANEASVSAQITKEEDGTVNYPIQLIGEVITEQELWACTTCRNCEDQCPVMNEHVDKIIDMRRYLVMTEGKMNGEASRTFSNIERQGNPWGISRKDRDKWKDGFDGHAPTVKEEKEFEYLFFVGSMGSYDNRSQKITRTLVNLLNHAGVKFAILGNKEKNSGDTPRRMGNEFLFQQLAMDNISLFEKHDVKKIITIDPHAYNVLKNEYPELGLDKDVEVYHHTQVLAELVREGRLKPTKEVKERITYHDSCYLGRYNGEYDSPRYILQQIPGVEVVEMERNRENGMCCGAGGGMMWMEETEGVRVNVTRTEQALEVNPTMIGSGCPYCLTMLSDGTKAKEVEDRVQTLDVVEILALSIDLEEKIEVADGVH
ncbi:4Fe-4S dicluster domain-containing protein [Hazenella sp. IB182357]|uniref:4Fe-4S dicluster domain-containing protein n=1 Tax=Polycladospora coralii TaxID=2771432 RepID=A0A926RSX4_9BACL|nr:(Fe-S)-binding protein [Polycladospora coralii]MBD1372060.1 4Fe-4S dicluster domain-containing protein [Polycladospora coralii]MBS7530566.1 4Fe-4S dicluster domain-containing protein [Polycladospora coralii]